MDRPPLPDSPRDRDVPASPPPSFAQASAWQEGEEGGAALVFVAVYRRAWAFGRVVLHHSKPNGCQRAEIAPRRARLQLPTWQYLIIRSVISFERQAFFSGHFHCGPYDSMINSCGKPR